LEPILLIGFTTIGFKADAKNKKGEGRMPSRHLYSCLLSILIVTQASAEETKTTYNITGSMATVTTIIKKASAEKEKLMRGYFFEHLAKKIRLLPNVTGIEFNKETKGEVSTSTYTDYWEYKRSYPVMVHLSLPSSVTMMLRVRETYRACKSPAEKQANATTPITSYEDYDGMGSSATQSTVDCTLSSEVKITGPFAVYGNFASSVPVDKLLKEKQYITYELTRDWSDKANMKMDARFAIDSELFDRNLMKFLDVFSIKLDGDSKVQTRNQLLVGIARILRTNNERLVE